MDTIRQATLADTDTISTVLIEAAQWLQQRGMTMWRTNEQPRLRAVYERYGFTHHSDRQVGPYFVARYELDVTCRERRQGAAGGPR